MRALLDVNIVIALLDPAHSLHNKAHAWWDKHASLGWASCPISENGVVRIMAGPSYSSLTSFSPPGNLCFKKRPRILAGRYFFAR